MKRIKLALKYILFAVISVSVNLCVQRINGQIYSGRWSLYTGILSGTGSGLLVKYYLDKRYIFYYSVRKRVWEMKVFIIYTVTGVVTTSIFWGFEIAFHFIFPRNGSEYIGAVIGLSIGYTVKYFLDKKFVFRNQDSQFDK